MSRNDLIELAGTLQAMRAFLLEEAPHYSDAADALIDAEGGRCMRRGTRK